MPIRIVFAGLIAAMLSAVPLLADAGPENIALGKKYTMSPKPGYGHCTDPDDKVQLTDGETTSKYFWTQKGTVGWQKVRYVTITLDLKKVEPISGVEMTTAAGVAGVLWPQAIYIQTSEDGKAYRNVGELVRLDGQANGPYPEKYGIRCLSARNLATRGRFVRFIIIPSGPFVFTDEIRVFRGDEALLQGDPTGTLFDEDVQVFVDRERWSSAYKRRLQTDLDSVRKLADDAKGTAGDKAKIAARLETADKIIDNAIQNTGFPLVGGKVPENFKAVLPLDGFHDELFRIQAAVWKAAGTSFHAEPVSPWEKSVLFGYPALDPATNPPATIEVHAMKGEYRAAAFNLYNASQEPVQTTVRIDGIPVTEFTLHDVPWTDTRELDPVMAALPEVAPAAGAFPITVLPGLPKQVYITFRPKSLPPKSHAATIIVESAGKKLATLPLTLRVWPLEFPEKTTLLSGGWSYTDGDGAYSVNPKNRPAFLTAMKQRFVNAPWCRPQAVMTFKYDKATGKVTLDTARWDDWRAQWPDAKEYCLFLSVRPTVNGIKCGEPDFDAAVTAWINAWVAHWRSQGIEPDRINMLVADEPGLNFSLEPLIAWSRAIRKAQPAVKLWTDPVYRNPKKTPPEVYEISDVICPNRPQWLNNKAEFEEVYLGLQAKGKTLQFYSCSGPVRLLDPYTYFRLQAWHVARIGGTGSFFWALGDAGGFSSWNEYVAGRQLYAPVFLDPAEEKVVTAKQMEAIREGTEDFETIQMLARAIAKRKAAGKSVADAEAVLDKAYRAVLDAEGVDAIKWDSPKDRTTADRMRVTILEAILALEK